MQAKQLLSKVPIGRNLKQAEEIFEQGAKAGDAIAQYQLYAIKLHNNEKNEETHKDALFWCKMAADQGYAPAQYDMSIHLLYGEGVEQDIFKSVQYMEKAADQGYTVAQQKLVTLYTAGSKVKKNEARASYWEARKSGIEKENLEQLLPIEPWMLVVEKEKAKKPLFGDTSLNSVLGSNFKLVEQEYVINAERDRSFIINAGPGTGKTYTLIERINTLVKYGVDPNQIIVLSFTNAVVDEVKKRLQNCANQEDGVRGVRNIEVRTYHSLAWRLLKLANQSCDEEEWEQIDLNFQRLNYEDGLLKAAQLVVKMPEIMSSIEYFVVDEIQDINNAKAKFVLALLKACIQEQVPFMLLGDSCQAIYDYLNDNNTVGFHMTATEFYEEILQCSKEVAEFVKFEVNHRQTTDLQELSVPIREVILEEDAVEYQDRVYALNERIKTYELDEALQWIANQNDKSICLMERSNIDTKLLSAMLIKKGVAHRCVLNNSKSAYVRWIGECFYDFRDDYIAKEQALKIMKERLKNATEEKLEKFWDEIKKINGTEENILLFSRFVRAIQEKKISNIFVEKDTAKQIVVSNIHRSKGLEYDVVMIDQNFMSRKGKEDIEEMKTLYVAITRPKKELINIDTNISKRAPKKRRVYGRQRKTLSTKVKGNLRYTYIELLSNDEYTDVGPENYIYGSETVMEQKQKIIRNIQENDEIRLVYHCENELYRIEVKSGDRFEEIGWMSKSFTRDVKFLAWKEPIPTQFTNIYVDGVYSYIGSYEDAYVSFEKKLRDDGNAFGKHCIWNYVKFSGPAYAKYEE